MTLLIPTTDLAGIVLNPKGHDFMAKNTAAFFDFDGTLYKGVIAFDFLSYCLLNGHLSLSECMNLPGFFYCYLVDKMKISERYKINRKIYSKVKGWNAERLLKVSKEFAKKTVEKRLIPETLEALKKHKKEGHKVVIVTSALKEFILPVKKLLDIDEVFGTEVEIDNGKYNGNIISLPVSENRAKIVSDFCRSKNLDPDLCYAYSDHFSDISMLDFVGNPVAVYPDRKLRQYALKNEWKIIS